MFVVRPDLRWLRPVPPSVLRVDVAYTHYDMTAVCPRHAVHVSAEWPCNNMCNGWCRTAAPRTISLLPLGPPAFQFVMVRTNERRNEYERFNTALIAAAAGCGSTNGLLGDAAQRLDGVDAAGCMLDVVALGCWRYDQHLLHCLTNHVPFEHDAPAVPPSDVISDRQVAASPGFHLFILSRRRPPATVHELQHVLASLPGVWCQQAVGGRTPLGAATPAEAGCTDRRGQLIRIPAFEAQCGRRHHFCTSVWRADQEALGGSAVNGTSVGDYVREICARTWTFGELSVARHFRHPSLTANPADHFRIASRAERAEGLGCFLQQQG